MPRSRNREPRCQFLATEPLTGREPDRNKVDALNKYLILLADHGMNASTFTARIVASTWSDMHSAVVAAICALKGPLHGGAPAPVLRMLKEIGKPERAEPWIREQLKAGQRLMGFGHRVYRTTDPRAEILRGIASKSAEKSFFELATNVEQTGVRILQEHRPERKLYTNVEFYSSVVMDSVGLPPRPIHSNLRREQNCEMDCKRARAGCQQQTHSARN